MQILVINLARATERMRFQNAQLETLGLAFDRVEAIDGNREEAVADDPIWNTWERPMSQSERACFLSHHQVWKRIAQGNAPALVLEDDVLLSSAVPKLLAGLEEVKDVDYVTLETRARKKLLARQTAHALPVRRLYQDRSGAAAYVLWPHGAQKLLARTERRVGLTDAILCSSYDLIAFQADPPLAIQADICEEANITSPLQTRSSVARISSNRRNRHLGFHYRRLKNQMAIGLRRLRYLLTTRREMLHVKPAEFYYLETIVKDKVTPQDGWDH
jgi:glycosyl transferase, family 25